MEPIWVTMRRRIYGLVMTALTVAIIVLWILTYSPQLKQGDSGFKQQQLGQAQGLHRLAHESMPRLDEY